MVPPVSRESRPAFLVRLLFRRFLAVTVTAVIGVELFVTLFFLVRSHERKNQQDDFQRYAGFQTHELRRRAESGLEVLSSVSRFYGASERVEAREFRGYVSRALEKHPEIVSLEWVPRIHAEERAAFEAAAGFPIVEPAAGGGGGAPALPRDRYFPIHYFESRAVTNAPRGWNYAADPSARKAMDKALRSPTKPAVTGRLPLPASAPNEPPAFGVRVFAPIFTNNQPTFSLADREQHLMGYVVGVFRFDNMVHLSLPDFGDLRMDLFLYNQSIPGRDALLYYHRWNATQGPPRSYKEEITDKSEPIDFNLGFAWADANLAVVCRPTPDFVRRFHWESWFVLLGGLLITGLLSGYLYVTLSRAEVVERLVSVRTSELAEMNTQLQNEIAERERMGQRLRDNEALYHSLVDTLPINILRKDRSGKVTFGNNRYCALMNRPAAELIGRTDADLFPPELAQKYFADDQRVIQRREIFEDIEEHRRPDGEKIYVQVIKAPVFDAGGGVVGTQTIFWDVTARKKAELDLEVTAADLARSNKELESFAYVASHDLQEPLRMVASYTQLLARRYEGRLDDQAREFISFAVDGAVRMQRLINDLLAYSRVGTRGQVLTPTDAEKVLAATLDNLKVAIDESQAQITHDPLPTVMADEVQLGQLFQNLIGNAVKFRSEAPPRAHVSARLVDDQWEFSVRDNGIGIDPQYFERIFVIFQRLHNRQEYPGTGIGLALCQKIVERHGGRIWVESHPSSGATFHFTFPRVKD